MSAVRAATSEAVLAPAAVWEVVPASEAAVPAVLLEAALAVFSEAGWEVALAVVSARVEALADGAAQPAAAPPAETQIWLPRQETPKASAAPERRRRAPAKPQHAEARTPKPSA